jgi:prepilin signal peptidase PulO-like enzyme (type II secretory pathway)
MDVRRLRPAELLALASGALLFVAMFLPWYEFTGGRRDAWSSMSVALVPFTAAVMITLYLFVVTATQSTPALPVAGAVWTTLLGLIATVFAVFHLLDRPSGAHALCYGAWLGFAGTVLITVAGWLSMRDERPGWGIPATTAEP